MLHGRKINDMTLIFIVMCAPLFPITYEHLIYSTQEELESLSAGYSSRNNEYIAL